MSYYAFYQFWNWWDWLKLVPTPLLNDPWFGVLINLVDADKMIKEWETLAKFHLCWILCEWSVLILILTALSEELGIVASFLFSWGLWPSSEQIVCHELPLHFLRWMFFFKPESECWFEPVPVSPWIVLCAIQLLVVCGHVMVIANSYKWAEDRIKTDLAARNDLGSKIANRRRDQVMAYGIVIGTGAAGLWIIFQGLKAVQSTWEKGLWRVICSLTGMIFEDDGKAHVGSKKPALVKRPDDAKYQEGVPYHQGLDSISGVASEEEKQIRETVASQWSVPSVLKLDLSGVSRNMTIEQTAMKVARNLYYFDAFAHGSDKSYSTGNLTVIEPCLALVNAHYFDEVDRGRFYLTGFRQKNDLNRNFKFDFSPGTVYKVPGTDTALVNCYGAENTVPTITQLFMDSWVNNDVEPIRFQLLYRNKEGDLQTELGSLINCKLQVPGKPVIQGGRYVCGMQKCFPGMCGAPIIIGGNGSAIAGIHTAGFSHETHKGYYASVTIEHINQAKQFFASQKGRMILPQMTPPKEDVYKCGNRFGSVIHPKNFLNFQKTTSFPMQPIATTEPEIPLRSGFKRTPISKDVCEAFGVEDNYMAPDVRPGWVPTQRFAEKAVEDVVEFNNESAQKAFYQYAEHVDGVFKAGQHHCSPFPMSVVMDGIPGRRFVKGSTSSTSIGPPEKGPKWHAFVDGQSVPRRLKPEYQAEFDQAHEMLERGEMLPYTARQFCKDEPYEKKKSRRITCVNLIINLLTRMYFLPLIEMIQMNPLLFCCAVGINAGGPEWEHMMDHVCSFGKDRILAFDHSGFDVHMKMQSLALGLDFMLHLARKAGYQEKQIDLMRTLCAWFMAPKVEIDGVVVVYVEGIWISGIPLTVIVNSIVNLLYQMIFFVEIYPKNNFFEAVKPITYGDDGIGSVKPGFDDFNVLTFANWLKSHGLTITSPNKKDALEKYYKIENADFLKRFSSYVPEIHCTVGALEWQTLLRSLIVVTFKRGSGMTLDQLVCSNFDSVLHEAFFHGREVYEDVRSKLKVIAENHNYIGWILTLDVTFDERVERWIKDHRRQAIYYMRLKGKPIPRAYLGDES
jgi:hypothetical protein